MSDDLPHAAQVAIAFGVQNLRGIRAAAATVLSRYAAEWQRDRCYNPGLDRAKLIARRFRLAEYYNCLLILR